MKGNARFLARVIVGLFAVWLVGCSTTVSTSSGPVSDVRATSMVGRLSVPVKCPVSQRMMPASTMPMTTARKAARRGSPVSALTSSFVEPSSLYVDGR